MTIWRISLYLLQPLWNTIDHRTHKSSQQLQIRSIAETRHKTLYSHIACNVALLLITADQKQKPYF